MIHKYSTEEARNLQAYGELPATARINQTAIDMAMDGAEGQEEDMGFDFDEVGAQYSQSLVDRCRHRVTIIIHCVASSIYSLFPPISHLYIFHIYIYFTLIYIYIYYLASALEWPH